MADKLPGISVVIPAYQAQQTICRAIASALRQDYPTLELIVVDDGSTDATARLAGEYAAGDGRVRVLRNPKNQGVAYSRNRGIQNARYPLIAFLDSDDEWMPEKLRLQAQALLAHPECALCFTAACYSDAAGRRSGYIHHVPQRVSQRELLRQNVIVCSSVLARRADLLARPMASNPRIHEDYDLWLSLLERYPQALGLDLPLVVYQVSPTSRSGRKLRSARMHWNTYRHRGLPLWDSCRYFCSYALRNGKKYWGIHEKMEQPATPAAVSKRIGP